ncbi:Uncharacterized protein FWK35_00019974, partial [Aphis craccivora]
MKAILVESRNTKAKCMTMLLFSNTVSKALQYCGEKQIIKNNNWEKVKFWLHHRQIYQELWNGFRTRRLNSDVLENYFNFIKGMIGSSTHISPLDLRWYLLGKYSNSVYTEHRNTEDTNEESLNNCLSANKAEIKKKY